MLARVESSDKKLCLKQAFSEIEEGIRDGRLKGYTLYAEKGSSSVILYETGTRNSMNPVAVRCGDKVSQMPPMMDEQGDIGLHRAETLKYKLAGIKAQIAFTPA